MLRRIKAQRPRPLPGKLPSNDELKPFRLGPPPAPVQAINPVPQKPPKFTVDDGMSSGVNLNDYLPFDSDSFNSRDQIIANTPVVPTKESGKTLLKTRMEAFYRAAPGMSVEEVSRRIRVLNEFKMRVEQMPEITAEEADLIAAEFMSEYSSVKVPMRSGVSADSEALLNQAYGAPFKPRGVVREDYDENELIAAASALASSLLFGGDVNVAQRLVATAEQTAQQRAQIANQSAMQEDQAKRQRVLEMYKRLQGIEDLNFAQQGYAADDEREMLKTAAREIGIQERGASQADAVAKRQFRSDIRKAIMDGDENRSAVLAKLYALEYPDDPLPEDIWQLSPTRNQLAITDKINASQLNQQLVEQYIEAAKWKNALSRETFDYAVKSSKAKLDYSKAQLDKLKIEIDKLPEYLDARTNQLVASAKAAEIRASAAMQRATSDAASPPKNMDQLKALSMIVSTGNTQIDNMNQQLNAKRQLLDNAQRRLDSFSFLPKAQQTQNELSARTVTVNNIKNEIKILEERMQRVAETLARAGGAIETQVFGKLGGK
jgi:hypothetical protein